MDILLKNVHIIDPGLGRNERGLDLEIIDGKIFRIGKKLHSKIEVRDLKGAVVAPGFCDMHVHLREPGGEHKETIETGTLAAAHGGFTAVCCMPNTEPAISDPFVVSYIKEKSRDNIVDVAICGTMTKGREGKELASLHALHEAGVRMISDDGIAVASAEMMRRVLEYAKMFEMVVTQHCEEPTMTIGAPINEGRISTKLGFPGWPSVAEEIIIARDILLTEYVGGVHYHVAHLSTAGAVRIVREAKARGVLVTAEVTPHHFTLDESAVEELGTMAKMNPPLRTRKDVEAILAGLKDGTIDCIASDHAPHAEHEKETDMISAAFGITGLETSVALGLSNLVAAKIVDLDTYIKLSSTNPRRILQLPEIKIREGEVANLTILDPNASWSLERKNIRSKSFNTPFIGKKFTGRALGVINNNASCWNV